MSGRLHSYADTSKHAFARKTSSRADLSLPLAPIEIGERRIYSRAVGSGQAGVEFQPISFAAMETASLWKFVRQF
jgi:hypothetical protein